MEKKALKAVLEALNPGDQIEVNFAGEKSVLSGAFKVLSSKTGRGKCGSRIASLESMTDHSIVSIGTKENDVVINITHNGVKHGFDSIADGNVSVSKDMTRALALKEKLKPLVGFGGRQVTITSKMEPELNGSFTLNSAELSKGRFGQIVASLTNNTTGKVVKLWSYRHSGLIDDFEIND